MDSWNLKLCRLFCVVAEQDLGGKLSNKRVTVNAEKVCF
jgi:hypothetical protein